MQGLPFQTPTQFVALALVLIAGWCFGLASARGGGRWRERYHDLDRELAGYLQRSEADLRDANDRIRDLEAENAQLRASGSEADRREGRAPVMLGAAAAGAVAARAAEKRDLKVTSEARSADHYRR